MNIATRGIRNAFRNTIRTVSIVIILGLSIGLALSMMIARQAVNDKITSVKSSIGNTITVTPAGVRGFEGGGTPLTDVQVSSLKSLANVSSVTSTLSDRLNTSNTNLVSSIEAGALGRRNAGNSGVGFQMPLQQSDTSNSSTEQRTFTPPIEVTGANSLSSASVYGGSSVKYVSGAAFDPASTENIAVVGKNLASKNNLTVGSTFTMYGTDVKVVGIYDTSTEFSNNGIIMPLSVLQKLSSQEGTVTSATVTANSVDNLNSVVTAIKAKLGSSADVVSDQTAVETAIAPLENVKTIATYSLIVALVAGAVIILLTMVMIVRERRREIGVMKAIGSSNSATMVQFMIESMTLTILGLIVGLVIAIFASAPITNTLVTNSNDGTSSSQMGPGRAGGFGGFRQLRNIAGTSLRTVETSIGWSLLGEGIAAALIIAIVGSAVPAYFISRVRPSEVMRAE